jgi:hypothetical protein
VRAAACAVVVLSGGLLALALAGELLRRRRHPGRVLGIVDHVVPAPVRTVAVSLLALLATLTPSRALATDGSVRNWLDQPTSTTTAAVVTPDALDDLVRPSPPPTRDGPVVLVPEEPAPAAPAPVPTTPAPVPTPEPVPLHVVTPGECLWSIAAAFLPPGSDDRAVDLTWRAIYELNRSAVGDDPALIHPGLVLRLPPPSPQ